MEIESYGRFCSFVTVILPSCNENRHPHVRSMSRRRWIIVGKLFRKLWNVLSDLLPAGTMFRRWIFDIFHIAVFRCYINLFWRFGLVRTRLVEKRTDRVSFFRITPRTTSRSIRRAARLTTCMIQESIPHRYEFLYKWPLFKMYFSRKSKNRLNTRSLWMKNNTWISGVAKHSREKLSKNSQTLMNKTDLVQIP